MVCSTCERKLSKVSPFTPAPGCCATPATPCTSAHCCEAPVYAVWRATLQVMRAVAAGAQVIVQDKWKDGARNTMESGGRKIGENKLLSKKKRCACL